LFGIEAGDKVQVPILASSVRLKADTTYMRT
jgi:hypothetical protein